MTATTTPALHSFNLTEKGHARMAADLPRITKALKHYATIILATYGGQPQAAQLQQDLANLALWTVELSEQLLATMETVSRAAYPGADWLSAYGQEHGARRDKEEKHQAKGIKCEIILSAIIASPYWIEQTNPGEVTIQHLKCPACGDANAWTLTAHPSFIKCTAEQCGANIRVIDLFPNLRTKLKAASNSEGTTA